MEREPSLFDDLDLTPEPEPLPPPSVEEVEEILAAEEPVPDEPLEEPVASPPPAATALSQRLAPGGGGGGCWLGGPKTASSEKYGNVEKAPEGFALFGRTLFGDEVQPVPGGALSARFTLPPFSVFDARQGVWKDRKRAWLSLGIQSELGRGGGTWVESATGGPDDRQQAYKARAAESFGQRFTLGAQPTHGGPGKSWAGKSDGERPALKSNTTSSSNAMQYAGGFEDTASGSSGTSIFDPVLCELAFRWFCPPLGAILDPFAGGSVRGIVAAKLGYQYLGVDLRPEQLAANEAQASTICAADPQRPVWITGDSADLRSLAEGMAFDFVFSCPPYADLEQYSDDPRDLSTMEYADFAEAYRAIIAAALAMLKPDRFACFVVGDVRCPKGLYRGLPELTVQAFAAAGAAKYNEAILLTSVGSLPIRVGKQFAAGRKLGKTHQNVLVFVKGDPKRAAEACNGQLEFLV
jgi:hypothetical protein